MSKKSKIILILGFLLLALYALRLFIIKGELWKFAEDARDKLPITKQLESNLPPPLIFEEEVTLGYLSSEGIFSASNKVRSLNKRNPLRFSSNLSLAAQEKVRDIFVQEYFDHVSPQGVAPSDLVSRAGYDYLSVGENLALGAFQNDEHVVDAWMKSPPHRKALLSNNFIEIGIAVGEGEFKGRQVWVAVQMFALPATVCVKPDPSFDIELEELHEEIDIITSALAGTVDFQMTQELAQTLQTFEAEYKQLQTAQIERYQNYKICVESYLSEE